MNEYSRTELLIGEEGLGRLKQATVMVFGVGGVGSLYRSTCKKRCGQADPDR